MLFSELVTGLGRKSTEVKCHFRHITVIAHITNMTYQQVDVDLTPMAEIFF